LPSLFGFVDFRFLEYVTITSISVGLVMQTFQTITKDFSMCAV